ATTPPRTSTRRCDGEAARRIGDHGRIRAPCQSTVNSLQFTVRSTVQEFTVLVWFTVGSQFKGTVNSRTVNQTVNCELSTVNFPISRPAGPRLDPPRPHVGPDATPQARQWPRARPRSARRSPDRSRGLRTGAPPAGA